MESKFVPSHLAFLFFFFVLMLFRSLNTSFKLYGISCSSGFFGLSFTFFFLKWHSATQGKKRACWLLQWCSVSLVDPVKYGRIKTRHRGGGVENMFLFKTDDELTVPGLLNLTLKNFNQTLTLWFVDSRPPRQSIVVMYVHSTVYLDHSALSGFSTSHSVGAWQPRNTNWNLSLILDGVGWGREQQPRLSTYFTKFWAWINFQRWGETGPSLDPRAEMWNVDLSSGLWISVVKTSGVSGF